jgi:hypothetical protein
LFPYDVKPIAVVAKENIEEKYSLRTQQEKETAKIQ